MADEHKAKPLEIAHVLFIDIVGYSKLLTDEQSEALQELNQIVRSTEAAQEAEAAEQLTVLPTGDGMALVFAGSVEEPVECALEISQALRAQPSLPVRMGIHSGPIHHVKDANGRENIAGVGINIAQRVMDCGDAGHILVSKRVADDLAQQRRWQRLFRAQSPSRSPMSYRANFLVRKRPLPSQRLPIRRFLKKASLFCHLAISAGIPITPTSWKGSRTKSSRACRRSQILR